MWETFLTYGGTLSYVLGAGAVLLGVLGVVAEFGPGSRVRRIVPFLALCVAAAAYWSFEEFRNLPHSWLPLAILSVACIACYMFRAAWFARLGNILLTALQRRGVGWTALAAAGLLICVAVTLVASPPGATTVELGLLGPQLVDESNLTVVSTLQAVTDRGRPVPLFAASLPPYTEKQLVEMESPSVDMSHLAKQLIRVGPPDTSYNCHGWLFLGGQYWVRGEHVSWILEDNGYQSIAAPRVGDIAIFRNQAGDISHCALVRGFAAGDVPILESKWGWGSRFLHQPHSQIYSLSCTYYHTERPDGHRLRLLISPSELPVPRAAG